MVITSKEQILSLFSDAALSAKAAAPLFVASLCPPDENCGSRCQEMVAGWTERFSKYAEESAGRFAVHNIDVSVNGVDGQCLAHEQPLAVIDVFTTVESYLREIGDSSRNMIRKAQRAGYTYAEALNLRDYYSDVFDIRNSTSERQGKPIPEYWKRPVTSIINRRDLCSRHDERFFGVFLQERLVAYCTMRIIGEMAQVNHVIGHADHLKNGIMNLLFYHIVIEIKKNYPLIRGINYLYLGALKLATFKRGLGFEPLASVVVKTKGTEFSEALRELFREKALHVTAPAGEHLKKFKQMALSIDKDEFWDGNASSAFSHALAVVPAPEEHGAKVLGHVPEAIHRALEARGLARDGKDENGRAGVCVALVRSETEGREFLGKKLKEISQGLVPRGVFLVGVCLDAARAMASGLVAAGDGDALTKFLGQRFKTPAPGREEIARSFRGTDFQLVGIIDEQETSELGGVKWLALRRISD